MAENTQEIVNYIWPVADEILRDDFKRGKYPDVILPFTVLRRLDCVLASTKEKVLTRHKDLQKQGIQNLDGQLRRAAGHSFYNISKFDFSKLLDDAKNIGKNLIAYLNGFSENMRDVVDNFGLRNNIDLLDQGGGLAKADGLYASAVSTFEAAIQSLPQMKANYTQRLKRTLDEYAQLKEAEGQGEAAEELRKRAAGQ